MKLNNKGFAISTVMYMILVLAVILITLTLSILSSRKLILDKIRMETNNNIYNVYDITYRQALEILKSEATSYATNNSVTKETIKISDLNSSINQEILDSYELSNKFLTIFKNGNTYDIYIGSGSKIKNINKGIDSFIDIYDYKIYGSSTGVGNLVTDSGSANYNKYRISINVGDEAINIYLDEPLRCIDSKCDYMDLKNGKVIRYIEVSNANNGVFIEKQTPTEQVISLPNIDSIGDYTKITINTDSKPKNVEFYVIHKLKKL